MTNVIDTIKNRRTTRKFLPVQIEEEKLNGILEAGLYAPSGGNNQPWHFLVIQNQEVLDYMSRKGKELMAQCPVERAAKAGASEAYHLFHHAPTVIIVSGHKKVRSPVVIEGDDWSYTPLADCSAAIQNMLLAAESLGVGSCWLGYIAYFFSLEEEVAKLNIPTEYKPFFAVGLGYKDPAAANATASTRKGNKISYMR